MQQRTQQGRLNMEPENILKMEICPICKNGYFDVTTHRKMSQNECNINNPIPEAQEAKKVEAVKVEVVEPTLMKVDEKKLTQLIETVVINIQKRDYRATMVHREEQGEVPSDVATFMHIDEDKKDELGNPLELDIKGSISLAESYLFKDVDYAMALASLQDWCFFEVPDKKKIDGTEEIIRVPVNLAQIDMLSKKRLNMSVFGTQSSKHIAALRAASGMPQQEKLSEKMGGWFGWRREKVPKQELDNIYGNKDQK